MTLTGGGTNLDRAAVQRRTVQTLVLSQAVGAVGITIGIATASLLAHHISGSERMAGLAQTFQVLGAAAAAYLLARLMARRGRRVGLVWGYAVGAAGALLCVVAGTIDSMVVLLLGASMLGTVTAANSGSRYAATDLAEPDHRGRALSVVVWATTIGAVAGPNLTGPAGRLAERLALPALTGPFLVGALAIAAAAVVVLVRLRPDPLLLARGHAAVPRGTAWPQVRRAFREQPLLIAAVAGLAGAHAAMVAVMVMTPLHMEHGGSELEIIGVVISTHVLGMFAFSPLMGLAADRVGPGRVLTGGGGILLVALLLCASSPSGTSWQIFAGLFLLGLGWSAATVAASTLVSVHAPLGVRTDVQGASDLTMNLTAAAGGGLAGVIVGTWGYAVLAAFSGLLAGVVVLAGGAAVVLASRARDAAA